MNTIMPQPENWATTPKVSYNNIHTKLSRAPSMPPRPASKNIRSFRNFLQNNLAALCSLQFASYGYTGIVKQTNIYVLTDEDPLVDLATPGNNCQHTDRLLSATQHRDAEVVYAGKNATYASQIIVRTAIIDALNDAVPEGYKSSGQLIGARVYCSYDCPAPYLTTCNRRIDKLLRR